MAKKILVPGMIAFQLHIPLTSIHPYRIDCDAGYVDARRLKRMKRRASIMELSIRKTALWNSNREIIPVPPV